MQQYISEAIDKAKSVWFGMTTKARYIAIAVAVVFMMFLVSTCTSSKKPPYVQPAQSTAPVASSVPAQIPTQPIIVQSGNSDSGLSSALIGGAIGYAIGNSGSNSSRNTAPTVVERHIYETPARPSVATPAPAVNPPQPALAKAYTAPVKPVSPTTSIPVMAAPKPALPAPTVSTNRSFTGPSSYTSTKPSTPSFSAPSYKPSFSAPSRSSFSSGRR
jgi:hypothetical protein